MNSLIAGIDQTKPTEFLKRVDTESIPEINILNESDWRRFVYTGISVRIDTPLVKNTRNALFAINIDGFIPPYVLSETFFSQCYKNLFPVQPFRSTVGFVKILQEQIGLPQMTNYTSHRFVSGNVGVGLRISSNTAQTGNFLISQASGNQRNYYSSNETYNGLRSSNTSEAMSDFAVGNFVVGDISLNRNISITPIRRDPLIRTDLAQKLNTVSTLGVINSLVAQQTRNTMSSQFLEDWLYVGILSDLPNSANSQITISIFFDYSQVIFETPLIPIISLPPLNFGKQILDVSTSLALGASWTKNTAVWLPGGSGLEEEPPVEEEEMEQITSQLVNLV